MRLLDVYVVISLISKLWSGAQHLARKSLFIFVEYDLCCSSFVSERKQGL